MSRRARCESSPASRQRRQNEPLKFFTPAAAETSLREGTSSSRTLSLPHGPVLEKVTASEHRRVDSMQLRDRLAEGKKRGADGFVFLKAPPEDKD